MYPDKIRIYTCIVEMNTCGHIHTVEMNIWIYTYKHTYTVQYMLVIYGCTTKSDYLVVHTHINGLVLNLI